MTKGGESRDILWMEERIARVPIIEALVNPESKDTFQFLGGGTAGSVRASPPRSEEGLCSQKVSNRATPSAYDEGGACNPRK